MVLQPTNNGAILSGYGNVAVAGTAIKLLSANPNRQEMRLINYSTAPDAFWGTDANVTTTTGFPIFSGSEQDASRGMGSMYLGDVWAISSGSPGSADIRILEICR